MATSGIQKFWNKINPQRPYIIRPYLGYGTDVHFYNVGRALVEKKVQFNAGQSFLRTVSNTYRLFRSNELKNVNIELSLPNGSKYDTKTDAEGYYRFDFAPGNLRKYIDEEGWLPFSLSFKDKNLNQNRIANGNLFAGKIMIPPAHAEYGVISDIDDTILQTGVTSILKWRLVVNSLFRNIDRRLPVGGAAELFQYFHKDDNGQPVNPIFYVSNSPWNLYIYLKAFLELNEFPKGPILLRDIRTPFDKTPKPKVAHKVSQIRNILNTYPELQFMLVGDNGQEDPEIYEKINEEYPGRIKDIYLREVR